MKNSIKNKLNGLNKLKVITCIFDIFNRKTYFILVLYVTLCFLFSICNPLISVYYKEFIDGLVEGKGILTLVLPYIFCQFMGDLIELMQDYFQMRFSYNIEKSLTYKINKKILSIKMEEFENVEVYNIVNRVNESLSSNVQSFFINISGILSSIIMTVSYIIILSNINIYLSIILIIANIPYYFVLINQSKENYSQFVQQNEDKRKMHYIIDLLSTRDCAKDIRIFKLFSYLMNKINAIQKKIYVEKASLLKKQIFKNLSIGFLKNISFGICLAIVCNDILNGKVKLGNFVIIFSALNNTINGLNNTLSSVKEIKSNFYYFKDYYTFINLPNEEKRRSTVSKAINFKFENVCFKYPNSEKFALNNICTDIEQGDKIVIVGENGSGKSTFINLLIGIYSCTSGKIIINDETGGKLYENTSVLFQNFIKYNLSLQDNIYTDGAKIKKVNEVFEMLDIRDIIEMLPEGTKTNLGQIEDGGWELSGGQWQKIALARVLIKNKPIIILDEATANLDSYTESRLYERLCQIFAHKTIIFITHKLAATDFCDKIIMFEGGRIIESGTKKELICCRGKFYKMYMEQSRLYAEVTDN